MSTPNSEYVTYGGNMLIFAYTGSTKQPIALSTSAKLSISNKVREISSKDSGDWTSKEYGKFDWNMSSDALMNFQSTGSTLSVDDLYTYMINKTKINVAFASKTGTSPNYTVDTSKKNFTGVALITSLDLIAGDGETATYSITLDGDGTLLLA